MANIITSIRIVCSIVLLFCPTFSVWFYSFYITAGFTDMIDGTVARKTNTVSEFGSKLDTIADFVFVVACLIKLVPKLSFPMWAYLWTVCIVVIKVVNIISGFAVKKTLVAVHSTMNKVTGGLLFLLPLTISVIQLKFSIFVICVVATFAALQEGYRIRVGNSIGE
ncbi:MAG: CDP-alcohol phosphatidyltransferase family protein [Clostridiales bacterium]|nr:CDP-alcohol phosphatidyltransferase family protein [Clostridiales bacterium]